MLAWSVTLTETESPPQATVPRASNDTRVIETRMIYSLRRSAVILCLRAQSAQAWNIRHSEPGSRYPKKCGEVALRPVETHWRVTTALRFAQQE